MIQMRCRRREALAWGVATVAALILCAAALPMLAVMLAGERLVEALHGAD